MQKQWQRQRNLHHQIRYRDHCVGHGREPNLVPFCVQSEDEISLEDNETCKNCHNSNDKFTLDLENFGQNLFF